MAAALAAAAEEAPAAPNGAFIERDWGKFAISHDHEIFLHTYYPSMASSCIVSKNEK